MLYKNEITLANIKNLRYSQKLYIFLTNSVILKTEITDPISGSMNFRFVPQIEIK